MEQKDQKDIANSESESKKRDETFSSLRHLASRKAKGKFDMLKILHFKYLEKVEGIKSCILHCGMPDGTFYEFSSLGNISGITLQNVENQTSHKLVLR
jgi:uncharacterized radical SAM superfamily Fe-S cluster-containing enzyme